MRAILAIPVAGGGFFLSSWILMIFARIVADDLGINPIGYTTSMLVTLGAWHVVMPLVSISARLHGRQAAEADGPSPVRRLIDRLPRWM